MWCKFKVSIECSLFSVGDKSEFLEISAPCILFTFHLVQSDAWHLPWPHSRTTKKIYITEKYRQYTYIGYHSSITTHEELMKVCKFYQIACVKSDPLG